MDFLMNGHQTGGSFRYLRKLPPDGMPIFYLFHARFSQNLQRNGIMPLRQGPTFPIVSAGR